MLFESAGDPQLLLTPRYAAPGCDGANYSSVILVRVDCDTVTLADCVGLVCAYNARNSQSGYNALRAAGPFFGADLETGSHWGSLTALLIGVLGLALSIALLVLYGGIRRSNCPLYE